MLQGTLIGLLGRLCIDRAGVPCPTAFPGRRAEIAFAYLAAEHRRDVSRDELADALWPEVPAWVPSGCRGGRYRDRADARDLPFPGVCA